MIPFFSRFSLKSYGMFLALLVFMGIGFFGMHRPVVKPPEALSATESEQASPLLTTMYRNRDSYADAFSGAVDVVSDPEARAVITSHHFLAAGLIARSYAAVANPAITRIILVSPDHFDTMSDASVLASTVDTSWDALFGEVAADGDFIGRLMRMRSEIRNVRTPFLREHGIYTEMPFLAHYFTQAKIVPLIVRNTYDYDEFHALGKSIRELAGDAPDTTLLVISSDFSHHATHTSTRQSDEKSISVLTNLSALHFDALSNDCRSCVALLSGYLEVAGASSFHLLENKDSTDFGGSDSDVTSYVSGYYGAADSPVSRPDGATSRSVSLLFGGDMMFDRSIRTAMRRHGDDFPLAPLKELFSESDAVIANLEGPITGNVSQSEDSVIGERENYLFTFDPSVAKTLKNDGVTIVNIGNNHILNFGDEGLAQTKRSLEYAGVRYFGAPSGSEKRYWIQNICGFRVAFVNFNQFVVEGKDRALSDIAAVKGQSDFIVVYAHWGKEYVSAIPAVKDLAHAFVDAGANLVIGSHPHVVEEHEVYLGKTIYYSLGNLVFDQYEEESTKNGLLVRVIIDTKTKDVAIEEIPVIMKASGQTILK